MQGHVTILQVFTPNIEARIASGGRISTMDGTADEILKRRLPQDARKTKSSSGRCFPRGIRRCWSTDS